MINRIKLIVLSILLVLAAAPAFAQKQINITTKKDKIMDFKSKTTKVVLSGNSINDEFLKDAISTIWRISPYEFCTLDEFNSLKTNESYYFLIGISGQSKKEAEPGITFLTLVKGGKEAEAGIGEMLEIVTIPYCSTKYSSGRELSFLPALLETIQDFTQKTLNSDLKTSNSLAYYNNDLQKIKSKDVIFGINDLSEEVTDEAIEKYFKKGMIVMDEDSADEEFSSPKSQSVVSYIVFPAEAKEGSFCYKMLFDSNTHDLLYFKKHKITSKVGPGFLIDDIKKIASEKPNK